MRRRQGEIGSRKGLEKTRDDAIKNFCSSLRKLTVNLYNKNKKDNDIHELKEKVKIATKDAPITVIQNAGAHIWGYRDIIRKGDLDQIITDNHDKTVKGEVSDEEELQKVNLLITKIKRTWRFFNESEKNEIKKLAKKLVESYASYLGVCKQLNALK